MVLIAALLVLNPLLHYTAHERRDKRPKTARANKHSEVGKKATLIKLA